MSPGRHIFAFVCKRIRNRLKRKDNEKKGAIRKTPKPARKPSIGGEYLKKKSIKERTNPLRPVFPTLFEARRTKEPKRGGRKSPMAPASSLAIGQ